MVDNAMERGWLKPTTDWALSRPTPVLESRTTAHNQTQSASTGTSRVPKVLNGFPRTSRFIAADPDKTTVIFRRFDEVSVRILLQLEARVAALEKVLNTLDSLDYDYYRDNKDMILAANSWEEFALLGSGPHQLPEAALDMWKKSRLDRRVQIAARDRETELVPPDDLLMKLRNKKGPVQPSDTPQTLASPLQRSAEIAAGSSLSPQVLATDYGSSSAADPDISKIQAPRQSQDNGRSATPTHETRISSESLNPPPVPLRSRSPSGRTSPRGTNMQTNNLVKSATELDCDPSIMKLIEQRWEVAEKLHYATKEYQEALLRYRDLLNFDAPAPRSAAAVRDWIKGSGKRTNTGIPYPQFGKGTAMEHILGSPPVQSKFWLLKHWRFWQKETPPPSIPMTGSGATTASENEPKINDLIGLRPSASNDPLSRAIAKTNWIFKLEKDKNYPYPEIDHVPEAGIQKYTTGFTMFLALMFLVGAVWALWGAGHNDHKAWSLLVLSFWVCAFALAMKFFTTGSRGELFATTAAYAAVLIVFVGKG